MGIVHEGWEAYKEAYLWGATFTEIEKAKHTFYHSTRLLVMKIIESAKVNRSKNIQGLITDNITPDLWDYAAKEKDKSVVWFVENVIKEKL